MSARAMIIVGGGSSTRFGSDKLLTPVSGEPLIVHTIEAVSGHVEKCVVVVRAEVVDQVGALLPDVAVTPGGATRTLSEMAGLAALGGDFDLIGIHDAARPTPPADLVEKLFTTAESTGGAVPVIESDAMLLDRKTHRPAAGLNRAQTPQVFRAPELMTAYVRAAQSGFEGQDTAEVVMKHTDLVVAAVPGDISNLKVTYPQDLAMVGLILEERSRT
jgi:2-C-methyl-D-erythritol 4-phosphate cytidylyltransferase